MVRVWVAWLLAFNAIVRSSDSNTSWWISGKAVSCFFFLLHKDSLHGEIRLKKVAGEYHAAPKLHNSALNEGVWA